jgi:hypothetical protein
LHNEQLAAGRIPQGQTLEQFLKKNLFNPVAKYPEQY